MKEARYALACVISCAISVAVDLLFHKPINFSFIGGIISGVVWAAVIREWGED